MARKGAAVDLDPATVALVGQAVRVSDVDGDAAVLVACRVVAELRPEGGRGEGAEHGGEEDGGLHDGNGHNLWLG